MFRKLPLAALSLACVAAFSVSAFSAPAPGAVFCVSDAHNSFCASATRDGGISLTPYDHKAVGTVAVYLVPAPVPMPDPDAQKPSN
ncbi:hypothetical protein [Methylobacterium nodulans]|uniref:Uncharacterized protein n=1 Tax=Methylobacterium nodulans (strain LMG 21967 / CNCM I-2342 / ORS 2060) TaxID=460265 RepID=B8IDT0_METNO|nr:hypothetical protein [Methylobacterium nodulans]ACL55652.1 hypothetical protein Mnod_0616 [Methylobacterium nodulans ORS 2060]